MTDVKLIPTVDDGDIEVLGGIVTMDDGLTSSFYTSLFGGNKDDAAEDDRHLEWWGNKVETDEKFKFRSRTQYLVGTIPATTFNLNRIKAAVEADLAWMLEDEVITMLDVQIGIPRLNWVQININTELGVFNIDIPWRVAQ